MLCFDFGRFSLTFKFKISKWAKMSFIHLLIFKQIPSDEGSRVCIFTYASLVISVDSSFFYNNRDGDLVLLHYGWCFQLFSDYRIYSKSCFYTTIHLKLCLTVMFTVIAVFDRHIYSKSCLFTVIAAFTVRADYLYM